MPRFALQGRLQSDNCLDTVCEGLASIRRPVSAGQRVLDLSGATEVDSAPLALLVASLRSIQRNGVRDPLRHLAVPETCVPPLDQSDLRQLLSDQAGYGLHEGGDAVGLRMCEPFSTSGGVTRAVSSIQMRIAAQIDWESVEVASFGALAADLAENVLQHARSDGGGVAALTMQPDEESVELAIADCGVGIRGSLMENPEYENVGDDLAAIKAAVGPGATSDPGSGGGYGLFLARLVVRDNGGAIMVRSGTTEWSEGSGTSSRLCFPSPGTLIVVRARINQPFNYDRIDDFLEDPVGLSD
jgi:ABC-type transporter Mla MlaB component/anti-sigma regulatory factor (Ser/Thr protein kinase)